MKQYCIVYRNLPQYKGTDCYLSNLNPIRFSTNPKDVQIFDFISEAEMLLELDYYKKCDNSHVDGKVVERIETIRFKEIQK